MRFKDIHGHQDVKERLITMVADDRLPHAIMLYGPEGSGKLMLARALVQRLHCTNPTPDGDSCGVCPACRQQASHNHVDTHYTFPTLKKKSGDDASAVCSEYMEHWKQFLDEEPYADFIVWKNKVVKENGSPNGQPSIMVREADALSRNLNFTPRASQYKVALVWLPEKFRHEAANKLLKLIEEPFPDTKLIFVSNDPQSILPTIFSRLQRIEVKKFDTETATEILVDTVPGTTPQAARDAAWAADGNIIMGRALLSDGANQERLKQFIVLMRLAFQRKVTDLRKWSEEMAGTGREAQIKFLNYCCRMMRENFLNNTGIPELTRMTAQENDFSQKFSRFINSRNVIPLIAEFEKAITDISANANAKIVFFDLAIHIILLIKN